MTILITIGTIVVVVIVVFVTFILMALTLSILPDACKDDSDERL